MPNTYNHVENKGLLNERHDNDLYVTPPALIRHFFETAIDDFRVDCPFEYTVKRKNNGKLNILDLGAGDARWGEGARRYLGDKLFDMPSYITAVDLEIPDSHYADDFIAHDYFRGDMTYGQYFDIVVSNPPFRDSLGRAGEPRPEDGLSFRDGIERTLNIAKELVRVDLGAIVLFHPAYFLWTQGRYERLFSEWSWKLPYTTYIIPWRVPLIEGETSGLPTEFAVSIWFNNGSRRGFHVDPFIVTKFLPPLEVENIWEWGD